MKNIHYVKLLVLLLSFGCRHTEKINQAQDVVSVEGSHRNHPQDENISDRGNLYKQSQSHISSTEDEESTEGEEEEDRSDLAEDEETLPSDLDMFEEGFCKDDIYASYLINVYKQKNKNNASKKQVNHSVVKNKKSSRRNRASQTYELSQKDAEALYYARSRMVGSMVPYLGALPVVANPLVERWLRYFKTTGQQAYLKWKVRGESFRLIVEPLLKQEGLPQELFFLAMVESGFNNSALSSARAMGPWQFMKGTAKLYGLKVGHWVDERRDPAKSTIAAARYLRDLYAEFGDWYLAMAAYNAGPGKIRRAIRKVGSDDFWDIAETKAIRAETKHYVPKVLAALILSSTSETKSFQVGANPADHIPSSFVEVQRPIQIDELAKHYSIPKSAIEKWNPELIRGITPPVKSGESYKLRLPNQYVSKFAQVEPNLSQIDISDVLLHKIRKGDTLARIAIKYGVRTRDIIEFNPGINPRALKLGKEMAIPVSGYVSRATSSTSKKKYSAR